MGLGGRDAARALRGLLPSWALLKLARLGGAGRPGARRGGLGPRSWVGLPLLLLRPLPGPCQGASGAVGRGRVPSGPWPSGSIEHGLG